MMFTKINWYKGYITIEVRGAFPEHFFDVCTRHQIPIWDIKKKSNKVALAKIKLTDIAKLRAMNRKTIHKLYFRERHGFPFILHDLFYKKPLIVGFFVAIFVIFFLSNIVWRIDIEGLDSEMDKKVIEHLESYGLTEGSFQWQIETPAALQNRLLADIPELLWIGVKKNGSTYYFEGIEKTTVEKEEEKQTGHLVAKKEGVIVDLFVAKGQPLVKPNDVVYPGDILVSSFLKNNEEEEENKEERKPLAAEGEVIAKVWYKSEVEMPLNQEHQVLSGDSEVKHYVNVSRLLMPIWNFSNPSYPHYQIDIEEKDFYFLKWKLPIQYVKQTIYEATSKKQELHETEAKELALAHAKRELSQKIPHDAEIKEEKVLHERVENGKVKLILYYTVLEDIAKKQPITQGD